MRGQDIAKVKFMKEWIAANAARYTGRARLTDMAFDLSLALKAQGKERTTPDTVKRYEQEVKDEAAKQAKRRDTDMASWMGERWRENERENVDFALRGDMKSITQRLSSIERNIDMMSHNFHAFTEVFNQTKDLLDKLMDRMLDTATAPGAPKDGEDHYNG